MVGDHYKDKWEYRFPQITPGNIEKLFQTISRQEFEQLKADVEELKKLWARAKEYDERTGQPNCEIEDKVALIKAMAKALNIDLKGVV
jgi:hypothetical protein